MKKSLANKKIFLIVGTRPEVIKMAPLYHYLKQAEIQVKMIATGQHRHMLDQSLNIFNIKPDYDLNIMEPNQTVSSLTANVVEEVYKILGNDRPDLVLVHGDTTTTLSASLAAYYCQIPVGHVESGLRTEDKYSPFPEEMNRRLVDGIADIHFAPTISNKENLLAENVSNTSIFITGNSAIDALKWMIKNQKENIASKIDLPFNIKTTKYILMTAHRRESFGQGIRDICRAIKQIAIAYPRLPIIYPVHLNPNIKEIVTKILGDIENIHLIQPQNYDVFIYMMSKCWFILTDSGGIQEEAPAIDIPVLVMREKTERQEAIEAGTVKLIGIKTSSIFTSTQELIENRDLFDAMANAKNPYGNGDTCEKILKGIISFFSTYY